MSKEQITCLRETLSEDRLHYLSCTLCWWHSSASRRGGTWCHWRKDLIVLNLTGLDVLVDTWAPCRLWRLYALKVHHAEYVLSLNSLLLDLPKCFFSLNFVHHKHFVLSWRGPPIDECKHLGCGGILAHQYTFFNLMLSLAGFFKVGWRWDFDITHFMQIITGWLILPWSAVVIIAKFIQPWPVLGL